MRVPQSLTRAAANLVAVVALALVFGPSLAGHVRHALNPLTFNDDVRQQIFPFFGYTKEGMAQPDLLGDYNLAIMPPGFRLMYQSLAPVFDPEPLSKALPYILFVVTLLAAARSACRLGGGAGALLSLALMLQTPIFLSVMTGGLARSFGFPLIALGFLALVAGRARALAALAVIAPAFYPVAAVILGLMLGALLFIVPRAERGEAHGWKWGRRVAVLVLAGALASAVVAPAALAMRSWGRLLGPEDAVEYPEVGSQGRYGSFAAAPVPSLFAAARAEAAGMLANADGSPVPRMRALVGDHEPLVIDIFLFVLALGLIPLATANAGGRRALALPLATAVGYALARGLAPYLYMPQRYVAFTVPLMIAVFLPAGGATLAVVLSPARWAARSRVAGALIVVGAALLLLGGRGDEWAGYTVTLDPETRIYEFIRGLPKDALVAGWPGGVIDDIPYRCRRRAFMTFENHNVLHERYVLEMRRRMAALTAALLSDDRQELMALRDTFGVTHLIVDSEDFSAPPWYFAPFDRQIKETWRRGSERGFAVERVMTGIAVFREGKWTVLDLSRL